MTIPIEGRRGRTFVVCLIALVSVLAWLAVAPSAARAAVAFSGESLSFAASGTPSYTVTITSTSPNPNAADCPSPSDTEQWTGSEQLQIQGTALGMDDAFGGDWFTPIGTMTGTVTTHEVADCTASGGQADSHITVDGSFGVNAVTSSSRFFYCDDHSACGPTTPGLSSQYIPQAAWTASISEVKDGVTSQPTLAQFPDGFFANPGASMPFALDSSLFVLAAGRQADTLDPASPPTSSIAITHHITLTPAQSPNAVVGKPLTLTATDIASSGPVAGERIVFQDANATTAAGTSTTNSAGQATFAWTPSGNQQVDACVDTNGNGVCDASEASSQAGIAASGTAAPVNDGAPTGQTRHTVTLERKVSTSFAEAVASIECDVGVSARCHLSMSLSTIETIRRGRIVKLSASGPGRLTSLGSKLYNLPGEISGSVTLKLGRTGQRLLTARRRVPATLTIMATIDGQTTTIATPHVMFTLPALPRKHRPTKVKRHH